MRKKILILGHNTVPHFIDIFNQYTDLFDKEKYEVTVLYLTGEPDPHVEKRTLAEQVIFLNLSKKNIRTLKLLAIKKILKLCRTQHYDLVICHRYKPAYIMMWVSLFKRIPTLIMVMHELKTCAALKRKLFILGFNRKDMWFAGVSNAVRDDISKDLGFISKNRILTLYNAIDVDKTSAKLLSRREAREVLALPKDAFLFGNLARLVPNKDHASLIKAFSMIKPSFPHAKLIIMGEGELEQSLKKEVDTYGLKDDILFLGFLAEGFRYMQAFDCFVLSSIQEAFGRVLIEAMVAKLPIIATEVHGVPEVMGHTGILIKPKDPLRLSTVMKEMIALSETERRLLGEKSHAHLLKHFSIPAFRKQFWGTFYFI